MTEPLYYPALHATIEVLLREHGALSVKELIDAQRGVMGPGLAQPYERRAVAVVERVEHGVLGVAAEVGSVG